MCNELSGYFNSKIIPNSWKGYDFQRVLSKGSFTYYVVTKREGGFGIITHYVIFALSNAEFGYGSGGGGLETDKK